MGITIKKNKFFLIWMVIGFMACNSNHWVFDEYKALDEAAWQSETAVEFNFAIEDTVSKNNLYINLRNTNKYAYSNLFLIAHLNFPDGKKIVDTLEYKMTDLEGNFLGTGFSEIKENKLFYKEQKVFPTSGDYSVSIQHAMRKNGEVHPIKKLEGISDVGFRIEKVE
jgi:gliding motility-associated lipoprotein GldH